MLKASAPQKSTRRGSWCLDDAVLDHRSDVNLEVCASTAAGLTCREMQSGIWVLVVVDLRLWK